MSEIMFFPKAELTETEKPAYELVDDHGEVLGKFAVISVNEFEEMETQRKNDEEIISKFWLYADQLDLTGGNGQRIREIISGLGAK